MGSLCVSSLLKSDAVGETPTVSIYVCTEIVHYNVVLLVYCTTVTCQKYFRTLYESTKVLLLYTVVPHCTQLLTLKAVHVRESYV